MADEILWLHFRHTCGWTMVDYTRFEPTTTCWTLQTWRQKPRTPDLFDDSYENHSLIALPQQQAEPLVLFSRSRQNNNDISKDSWCIKQQKSMNGKEHIFKCVDTCVCVCVLNMFTRDWKITCITATNHINHKRSYLSINLCQWKLLETQLNICE